MTPKQERFCVEYIKDGNATQAAIRAGYEARSAHVNAFRLLRNDRLRAHIKELTEADMDLRIAKAMECRAMLTAIARGQTKDEVLRFDGNGKQVIDQIKTPAKDRIKAIETLLKTDEIAPMTEQVKVRIDYGE